MGVYQFFYDESEHSRKINYRTLSAKNYYDNFVAVILGVAAGSEQEFSQQYAKFEEKYAERKDRKGELKSTTIKPNQMECGFASMNRANIQFVDDFLSLVTSEMKVFFSATSKIEYIVMQLLKDYQNNLLVDADFMKYSVIKALNTYRPQEVVEAFCNAPENFVDELKKFLYGRIEENSQNLELKNTENMAFEVIRGYLEVVTIVPEQGWDYHAVFKGFQKYINEEGIAKYSLLLDKEGKNGEDSKTLTAANDVGFTEVKEADSMTSYGLRMADMIAGILGKLLKALCDGLRYHAEEEMVEKKLLKPKWFQLSEAQLLIYQKLYRILCK